MTRTNCAVPARIYAARWRHTPLLPALLALLLCACSHDTAKHYTVKGVVVSLDKQQMQVVLNHQAIAGLMQAMTMGYPVKDAHLLDALEPGDNVEADLVMDENAGAWLAKIKVVSKALAPGIPASPLSSQTPLPPSSLKPFEPAIGHPVPDFLLVNQDGRALHLRDLRGKAVVLTFFYTSCPFPEFCPLMTKNFSEIDSSLSASVSLRGKARLLSVSFDPKNDTPKALREYAKQHGWTAKNASAAPWEFASARPGEIARMTKFFGLQYWEENGQITHSLRTAIIAPDGTLYKTYIGNDWTTTQLLTDLTKLVRG